LLTRIFRRWLVVVSVSAAATILFVTIALAVKLKAGTTFSGPSKHKHYGLMLLPQCFGSACPKATTIGVQVTIGNAKHPGAKCIYGTFQLSNAPLHNGRFTSTGDAFAGSRTFKLKVTGTFSTPTTVHGTVTGPKACGGTDAYHLLQSPQ
jgi:hypothetical protein